MWPPMSLLYVCHKLVHTAVFLLESHPRGFAVTDSEFVSDSECGDPHAAGRGMGRHAGDRQVLHANRVRRGRQAGQLTDTRCQTGDSF